MTASLRGAVRGAVHLPGDADWDAVRQPWQLRATQHPAAVVVPQDAADVAACVAACAALGLRVAPQGTGHGAAVLPSLEGTVLLRTTRLDAVEVDAERRVARVGAGATASGVAAAAGAHGLAAVLGMAPTVGITGLTLGGGLGWLVRSHGTAARQLLAADVVDAEGRARTVTPASDPELLWALRGGTAPVVVTALELQLHPLETLVAGGMLWPLERAAEVAAAWRTWALAAPEEAGSLLRVLRYPPIPELPEPLRGRAFVGVEVAIQRGLEDGLALLKPLLDLAPETSTVALMPAAQLSTIHGDPPDPSASFTATAVLRELSEETVERFIAAALADEAAPLVSIELRHLGGRAAPDAGVDGAVTGIAGEGIVFGIGILPFPEALPPVVAAARALTERLRPSAADAHARTFAEEPVPPEALYGAAVGRLREITDRWDPTRRFVLAHALD